MTREEISKLAQSLKRDFKVANRDLHIKRMWAVAKLRMQEPNSPYLNGLWIKLKMEFMGMNPTIPNVYENSWDPLEQTDQLPMLVQA